MKEIIVKEGYCYEMQGTRLIPSIVFNSREELVAGKKWLEDIIKDGEEKELQVIVIDELLEHRKDGTETWQKLRHRP